MAEAPRYAWKRSSPAAGASLLREVAVELGLEVPWHEKLARALVPRGLQLRRALADLRSDDPRVRDRGLRSLGILKDPRATQPILDIIDGGYRDWHAFAVQVVIQIGDAALPELDRALHAKRRHVQLSALGKMRQIKTDRAVSLLSRWVDSEDPDIRQAVAGSLAAIDTPRARQVLARLKDDTDERVSYLATTVAHKSADVKALVAALAGDDFDMRESAATALAERPHPDASAAVRQLLRKGDDGAKRGAVMALGMMKDREAVDDLMAIVADVETEVDLREEAIGALGAIGDPRIAPALTAAADADPEIAESAMRVLAGLTGGALEPYLRALSSAKPAERRKAAKALVAFRAPAALPALIAAMKDEHAGVREGLAEAIAAALFKRNEAREAEIGSLPLEERRARRSRWVRGDRPLVATLVPLLRDPSDRVREALAGALGTVWCDEVKIALMPMTSDGDLAIRRAARTAFAHGDDPDVLNVLERALDDDERVLRQEAVSAIGGVDEARAVSILVDVLAGSDEAIRFLAVQELGHHTWAPHVVERVIQALLAVTSDADAYVRSCAVSALKYALIGYVMRDDFQRTVVNAVAASLHEKEVGARYAAADALRQIGGVHAARALVSGLDDDEAQVRRMVAAALLIVAEPVTRGPIAAQLARESDETTRAELQRALDLIDQKIEAGRRA